VPVPEDDSSPSANPQRLYGRWYYDTYTVPYEENDHWRNFFGSVADNIIRYLQPRTVLDAGCAKGFLVAALRERGVEAFGFDLSEWAIDQAPAEVRPYLSVGSLTSPIEGTFDLVTNIEVIEHLDPVDAPTAVANLCQASDRILLSSTPGDQHEPTHVNVQPPERWAQLFAGHGFFRSFRHDAGYLSPWAVLYEREQRSLTDVVVEYDRAWTALRVETLAQRRALLNLQGQLEDLLPDRKIVDAEIEKLETEREDLRKEVLRLRDSVVGKNAELGTALGQLAEVRSMLERAEANGQRLDEILASRSWRLMWALGTPVRMLRRMGR
jgi:SAM-dependent methyltransferase